MFPNSTPSTEKVVKADRAKRVLSRVALFLGELRDGLTMVSLLVNCASCKQHMYASLSSLTFAFLDYYLPFVDAIIDQYAKCIPHHLKILY